MDKVGIKSIYNAKYNPNDPDAWKALGLESKPDLTYVATGFKASVFFMPKEVMSQYNPKEPDEFEKNPQKRGPAGGGWIKVNKKLQVIKVEKDGSEGLMGNGRIFAVGDCNMMGDLPPIPKISYPGEEQAVVACRQIDILEEHAHGKTVGCYNWPKQ